MDVIWLTRPVRTRLQSKWQFFSNEWQENKRSTKNAGLNKIIHLHPRYDYA
jgi:hypothetical protein